MGTYDTQLDCFKAYDVRGRVPDELNEEHGGAHRPGLRAAGATRTSGGGPRHPAHQPELSPPPCAAVWRPSGVDVVDIGLVGTEEVYFATFSLGLDGGIMVTASHNPRDYNGMKFTRDQARPISADTGLLEMEAMVRSRLAGESRRARRRRTPRTGREGIDRACRHPARLHRAPAHLHRRRIACSPSRSSSTPATEARGRSSTCSKPVCPSTSSSSTTRPTVRSPTGCPTPCCSRTATVTAEAVVAEGADLGIAWDGDFDRCFFFDERGDVRRGLLPGGAAGGAGTAAPSRGEHHPRPAAGLEHRGDGPAGRRSPGGLQERPRLHQGEDARGRRGLRRRDVGPPLLPRVLLLRQRHDPLAAGRRGHLRRAADRCPPWWTSVSRATRSAGRSISLSPTRRGRSRSSRRSTAPRPSPSTRSTG